MWQLDMFGPPKRVEPELPAPEVASEAEAREPEHPRQLGLFAALLEHRRRGVAALLALDTGAACAELERALEVAGDLAPALRAELDLAQWTTALLARCAAAERLARPRALRDGLGDRGWPDLVRALAADVERALWRRLGEEIEAALGAGGVLDGTSAGEAFRRAGAVTEAVRALEATVGAHPGEARHWIDLGNARYAAGEARSARAAYLAGLLVDPLAVEVGAIVDPAVQEAAAFAATDLEVPGDPRPWTATAGLLLGTFRPDPVTTPTSDHPGTRFFTLLAAVERARASGDASIPLRRELRALAPDVFKFYLTWIS